MFRLASDYFYGNRVSEYGRQYNRLDYATLAKAFDAVLNNDIMTATENAGLGYWEQVSGMIDYSDDIDELQEQIDEIQDKKESMEIRLHMFPGLSALTKPLESQINELQKQIDELQNEMDYPPEVYQWYIISDNGARILDECDEIVYYNEEIDMYLWGVTHWGTGWDYVLTDIPLNCGYENI